MESSGGTPRLTDTQDYLTDPDVGPWRKYRRLAVGDDCGWGTLLAWEAATGLAGPFPGALGHLLRKAVYPPFLGTMGKGCALGRNVTLRHPSRIRLGRGVVIDDDVLLDARDGSIFIGDRTIVARGTIVSTRGGSIAVGAGCSIGSGARVATLGEVVIEDFVLVAANCYLGGPNHASARTDVPIISQGMEPSRGVRVGRGAWLGAGSIVLDGASVGADAIVGALSLVNADIPPMAVAVGQPARVLRYRDGR